MYEKRNAMLWSSRSNSISRERARKRGKTSFEIALIRSAGAFVRLFRSYTVFKVMLPTEGGKHFFQKRSKVVKRSVEQKIHKEASK